MKDDPDQIDAVLQRWAEQHEPSDERLRRLRQGILERSQLPGGSVPLSVAATERERSPSRWLALAVALAGVALVLMSVLWPKSQDRFQGTSPSAAAIHQIPQPHLRVLLDEMRGLFGQRLAWVAETDRDVSLGLDDQDSPASPATHVAVRVVVFQRDLRQNNWRPIWKGDVLTRAEELIHVTSSSDGSQWSLWTHVLPDGALSIDTELTVPKQDLAVWHATSVQQPQVPCQLAAAQLGDEEFQIWQTATLISEGAL